MAHATPAVVAVVKKLVVVDVQPTVTHMKEVRSVNDLSRVVFFLFQKRSIELRRILCVRGSEIYRQHPQLRDKVYINGLSVDVVVVYKATTMCRTKSFGVRATILMRLYFA